MTAARRPQPSVATWRALGAVALASCLAAAVLAAAGSAFAATNWTVARSGGAGGTGQARPIPAPPAKPSASCDFLIGNTIDVSWQPVTGALSYTVYRNGGAIGTYGATTTSISDSLLSLLGSFSYTVTANAYASTVSSTWSSPKSPASASHSIVLLVGCL